MRFSNFLYIFISSCYYIITGKDAQAVKCPSSSVLAVDKPRHETYRIYSSYFWIDLQNIASEIAFTKIFPPKQSNFTTHYSSNWSTFLTF